MRTSLLLVVGAAVALTSACYRVTVVSGAPMAATPAPDVAVPWAHGFVFGLVPPATVSTAAQCREGVARVVTEQSLVNGLAQYLTGGLYTPQTISVNCATGPVRTGAVVAPAPQVAAVPAVSAPAPARR